MFTFVHAFFFNFLRNVCVRACVRARARVCVILEA